MPRETRWLPKEAVAKEGNTSKKRKKVAKEVVQKEGVEVTHSGIEEETMVVAPTKPAAAATVEVVGKVVAEKKGDAPEAPSSIEEESTKVAVVEVVAVSVEEAVADKAPVEKAASPVVEEESMEVEVSRALIEAAVLTQELELAQEE
jgi:hypothetical protein